MSDKKLAIGQVWECCGLVFSILETKQTEYDQQAKVLVLSNSGHQFKHREGDIVDPFTVIRGVRTSNLIAEASVPDISLLRKFDPEAVMRGDKICFGNGDSFEFNYRYLFGPDFQDKVFMAVDVENRVGVWDVESLRMAPIAWVETKPVYPGDNLFYTCGEVFSMIEVEKLNSTQTKIMAKGKTCEYPIHMLTWEDPRTRAKIEMLEVKLAHYEANIKEAVELRDAVANELFELQMGR